MTYQRDNIDRLAPYVPGEQPLDEGVIKLNTNENPYPPAEAVLEAVRGVSLDSFRRYPPPDAAAFRSVAAATHGVKPDMVIATNGGDELLRLALTVFCEPAPAAGGGLMICEPTYSLYATLGAIHDTPVKRVPLEDDFSLPADFAERVLDTGCRLAMIVSPHAPSGCLRPLDQLAAIGRRLQGRAVLLVDEAYVDFARSDALGLLSEPAELDNVLLLRTLSKGYSLAGLRFGYGLAHPALIESLDKARDSYNTDIVSQVAAMAALTHRDQAARTWQAVKQERSRLARALTERGYRVVPSESNFLLAQPPRDVQPAEEIYLSLKRKGIYVRYFDQERLCDRLRITVGNPQQNAALLEALGE